MDIVQFLGFLITAGAMLFIVARRVWEDMKRRQNPELYEAEKRKQEETLRKFLKSLEIDMEDEKPTPPPPPPPPPKAKPKPKPKAVAKQQPQRIVTEERQFKTAIEERYKDSHSDAYAVKKKDSVARGTQLLNQLQNKQDMVVLYEIFNKPKGLQ